MKKFLIAALAASVVATPALAAPDRHDNRGRVEQRGDHHAQAPQAQFRNGWRKGERFNYRQARNYQVIGNYRQYHLNAAPRGYRWVRSGNDAVLVGITSGIIASVLANAIR